ncbi:MAG: flavin reductase family protein [Acidobacteriota bacterium]|nr:flavin reductase family protein [Acidobacteriota bacterium]
MKVEVEYLEFMWPMRHYLITSGDSGGKNTIAAVSFCLPVSKQPPLVACALGLTSYSRELIEVRKEFIVNIPPASLKAKIYFCGSRTGREIDKFEAAGLTPVAGRRVSVPIVDECLAHLECQVKNQVQTGDKMLFIGQVVEAYADEEVAAKRIKVDLAWGDFPQKYALRFQRQS